MKFRTKWHLLVFRLSWGEICTSKRSRFSIKFQTNWYCIKGGSIVKLRSLQVSRKLSITWQVFLIMDKLFKGFYGNMKSKFGIYESSITYFNYQLHSPWYREVKKKFKTFQKQNSCKITRTRISSPRSIFCAENDDGFGFSRLTRTFELFTSKSKCRCNSRRCYRITETLRVWQDEQVH